MVCRAVVWGALFTLNCACVLRLLLRQTMEQGICSVDSHVFMFNASSVSFLSLSNMAENVGSVIHGGSLLSSLDFLLRHNGRPVSLSNSTTLNQSRFLEGVRVCLRGMSTSKLQLLCLSLSNEDAIKVKFNSKQSKKVSEKVSRSSV